MSGRMLVGLMLAAAQWCAAQEQPLFEHLGRKDGLPGAQVLALFEDRDGFIWIGTDAGLARHEGVRIHTWFHDRKDPRSLSNNVVWDITSDEQGTVWIATDHGVCAYDRQSGDFQRVFVTKARHDATSANRVHHIAADGHGLLWLGTEDGMHTLSVRDHKQVPLPADGDQLEAITSRRARGELAPDLAHQGIWIGVRRGCMFYDAPNARYITAPSPALPFPCLEDTTTQHVTPDGQGGVWYALPLERTVAHADRRGRVTTLPTLGKDHQITNTQFIRVQPDGTVWMSTWTHELYRIGKDDSTWAKVVHDDAVPWSITDANAKSWLEDRAGRIWIGTYNGLNVIDPHHTDLQLWRVGTGDMAVTAIAGSGDSLLLAGTDGHGLYAIDRHSGTQRNARSTADPLGKEFEHWCNYPSVIMPDGDRVWLGARRGVATMSLSDLLAERPYSVLSANDRLRSGTITFIDPRSDGSTWVGTWNSGVYNISPEGEVRHVDSLGGTPLPRMTLSFAKHDADAWIGFNGGAGLYHIRDGRVVERLLHEPDSSGTNYGVVLSLAAGDDGTLYIGTVMGGLAVREPRDGRISWYTRSDGLTGDRVDELVLDRNNGLWVRTNNGLCRFDCSTHEIRPSILPASLRATGTLGSIALDHDGRLLLAQGPLIISMSTDASKADHAPAVELTRALFAGTAHSAWHSDSTIILQHDQRALAIEFGVSSFFDPLGVRFAYRVNDLDTAWTNLGSATRLDLNDLPPGEHLVQVRANNGGSAWSTKPMTLRVHVLPPFWSTWWFRLTAVLTAVVAAVIGFRLYLRERLREQRERFEREQAVLSERMRIAGDMHDDLGAGLSALKLRSEMALRIEKDPAKREQLGSLAKTAGELIGSMRQIIWTMNADQATVEDLVVYATSYARTYGDENGLHVEVVTIKEWPNVMLTSEQRRNVFLVMKEALHNIVKHAQAGTVRVVMGWQNGLAVDVQDDGIGLPTNASGGVGNGLRNMEKRIHALNGRLYVEQGQGLPGDLTGTRVRFSIPIGAEAPNERSIASNDER